MKYGLFLCFFLLPLLIKAQPANILVGSLNNPNEPSIAIDPEHPNRLLAGGNIFNYYLSNDTGRTWTEKVLTSTYGVWGDPVMAIDTAGQYYFFHLSNPPSGSWIDRIVCQTSADSGQSWNNGSYTGLNGGKAQDKQWVAINRRNNHIYMTWTQFDEYASTKPADSSIIRFSKSTDAGATWSEPVRLCRRGGDCLDDDSTVEGAVPAVGPNGEVYVSWAGPGGIWFDRSLDGGKTWLSQDIHVDPMPGGWNYQVPGLMRCNGLPVIICDTTNGPRRGTIYLNWSDQRNGTEDTDIWLSKSTDGGDTWTEPVRVNDDAPGKHQFFTWMALDPVTGYLHFVFYDRRNHSDNATDVYMAVSKDGGETFINEKASASPFVPTNQIFFGDYNNIVAYDGIVRPVWTRLHNGELSVWTALIHDSASSGIAPGEQEPQFGLSSFPNPGSSHIFISFKLHQRSLISLSVYNALGQEVLRPAKGQYFDYGKHILPLTALLPKGLYYYTLTVDGKSQTKKLVVE